MADTAGGSLLPVAPAFRIDVQMGGVKFDASGVPRAEQGEIEIDNGELFDGLFTIRDASGVYKQYSKSDKSLHKEYKVASEFKTVLDEKSKEKEKALNPLKIQSIKETVYRLEGFEENVLRQAKEVAQKETKERARTWKQTKEVPVLELGTKQLPIVETIATSTEGTQTTEPKSTEMAIQTNNNTIGISSSVKEELRKILKDDAKLNEAVKLLNETEPGKLRSNIIFNPEYKVVADLIKSIVAFKIKEYVDMLEEDGTSSGETSVQASTSPETLPEETSGQNVDQTSDQAGTSPEETSDQSETLPEQTSVQNVGQTSDQPETLPENQTANLPETNMTAVNTTLFENKKNTTTTNQSGGKTKKTKGKLRKLKTRKQRKVNRQ
jgi:hypothetical protein